MVILITGATHTGKTLLAQRLLEKYRFPYLSIDHLKMGLIRSGYCGLTPVSGEISLTRYLWPVVREIIKTVIENDQDLIVEGCYIPFDFQSCFEPDYLRKIQFLCLIFAEDYIQNHYDEISKFGGTIERRLTGALPEKACLIKENESNLAACLKYGLDYCLITEKYEIFWDPRPGPA